jgi:hypothetical protein
LRRERERKNNNSVQFNWYLLTCRLNSKSACYKTSAKAKIQLKTAQIHKTNSTNKYSTKTNKTNKKETILQEKKCKSTGAKPLYSKKTRISLFKNVPV